MDSLPSSFLGMNAATPEGASPRGSLGSIFSIETAYPTTAIGERPSCSAVPRKGFEAGSHHNSGCLFHYLNSGIPDPENHRKFPDPAVPKRGSGTGIRNNYWTIQHFSSFRCEYHWVMPVSIKQKNQIQASRISW